MIHALKIAMVHKKIIFMVKVLELPSSKTKIAMLYKIKLPHGNYNVNIMQLLGKQKKFVETYQHGV